MEESSMIDLDESKVRHCDKYYNEGQVFVCSSRSNGGHLCQEGAVPSKLALCRYIV